MAISLETINVGVENQSTGSDSLFVAFTKTQNNFTKLSTTASPYNTFNSGTGIQTESFIGNGTVKITNTGVVNIIPGTGLTASSSNGNVTLSISGYANGSLVAGVTSVGLQSTTLSVPSSPIVSSGSLAVDLSVVNTITPGSYITPTMTVDRYGRVTSIANNTVAGTVTSVAVAPGTGISITGGPVTSSGTITVTNDGVTRLNAGPGIVLSGHTGEITVSSSNPIVGTVSSVGVTSNTLTVTGGPITSTGVINIEMPETDTMTGTFTAGNLVSTGNLTTTSNANIGGTFRVNSTSTLVGNVTFNASANVLGNASIAGNLTVTSNTSVSGNLSVTSNASITGNLSVTANANVSGNLTVTTNANISGNVTVAGYANFTGAINGSSANVSGNITSNNIIANTYLRAIGGLLLDSNNGKYVALSAQDGVSANYAWGWPVADGSANSFISTDGAGSLSFRQPASSSAPLTSGSAGIAGQIAYDATHIYVCIATNSWIRADAATW